MRRTPEQVETEMLVLNAQAGDPAAFTGLVRAWHERMRRHARLLSDDQPTADDAVQETWIAILRGLRRLADPADFAPWAMRIVSNKCADAVRGSTQRRALQGRAPANPRADIAGEPDDQIELRRTIESLPPPLRETVSLYYGCGLTTSQTADALAIPEGTVKSRLNEARTRLRAAIERTTA